MKGRAIPTGLIAPCGMNCRLCHPKEAIFGFEELESHLEHAGFSVEARRRACGFGFYAARKRTPAPVSNEEERI